MKEIKDVIQNNYRFNNIDLERNFDKEMEDDTFKKIVSKIKLSKDEIIKEYIKSLEGSFAFEVEKIKLLAGRKKTQLETDLNDIKTEIKDLKKQACANKLDELKTTKRIKVLEKELLQREEKLFYDKAQIDVETEKEIADLTDDYNFNVLMSPHFKVQIFSTNKEKQPEPELEELVLEDSNNRYCIKPQW